MFCFQPWQELPPVRMPGATYLLNADMLQWPCNRAQRVQLRNGYLVFKGLKQAMRRQFNAGYQA